VIPLATEVDEALTPAIVTPTAVGETFPATTVRSAGAEVGYVWGLITVGASVAGNSARLSVATGAFIAESMATDLLALAVGALVDAIRELDFALARRVTGMLILDIACKGTTGCATLMRELRARVCCFRTKDGS